MHDAPLSLRGDLFDRGKLPSHLGGHAPSSPSRFVEKQRQLRPLDPLFRDSRKFYRFAVKNNAAEWKTVACYAAKD